MALKNGLKVVQSHWNWHCLIDRIRLSIGPTS